MGITQWQLRRPTSLKGVVQFAVPAHIRLLLVSDQEMGFEQPILQDILRSLELSSQDCLIIERDQLNYLQDYENKGMLVFTQEKMPELEKLKQNSPPVLVQSTSLERLQQDGNAKRQLWLDLQPFASL